MPRQTVTKVHVIFKTHLDIGFTDDAGVVVERYLRQYIPAAVRLAREMREAGGDRFIWTTGSWLIHTYWQQAAARERTALERAILAGDIAWHGLPFTTHTELMDPALFAHGLSLSLALDEQFHRQTIAAKLTDVPGHTIGMVPWMAEAGLRFLHIGVNPVSRAPAVPPAFVWRHPSGAELVVMYEEGAYGDVSLVPGMTEALAFAHTGDNCGPQSAAAIRAVFARLRDRFPGAEVVASTLDAYARALLPHAGMLPVVAAEIGDTWIHGVGSDPWKVAAYRSLCRLRARWLMEDPLLAMIPWFQRFSERLLLIPEHTWGLDEKTHLADYRNYARADFAAARARDSVPEDAIPAGAPYAKFRSTARPPRYSTFAASWEEQRGYVTQAVEAVHPDYARQAKAAVAEVEPRRAPRDEFVPMTKPGEPRVTNNFYIRFDPATGALVALEHTASGRRWATARNPFGLVRYQTFSQAEYDRYLGQYGVNLEQSWCSDWAVPDFSKPGMAAAGAESRLWLPSLTELREFRDANDHYFLARLALPEEAVTRYGAPAEVEMEYAFPAGHQAVYLTVQWFNKAASRLPEALWCSFVPRGAAPEGWLMEKLGSMLSPLDVVKYGNRRLHAVGNGVCYQDAYDRLLLETRDAPLVAPGEPGLLDFDQRIPNLKHGWHFCLYNNVWGSNFPMWNGEDGTARFAVIHEMIAGPPEMDDEGEPAR
ncbi:MAG TPA: DUF5054 domain-containing protein [Armatimonadota bacterium]|nr:DUF5054 domain-containing protein [Armatimonadota bacterium]